MKVVIPVLVMLVGGCVATYKQPPTAKIARVLAEIPEPVSVWYQIEHHGNVWNTKFGPTKEIVDPRT